MYFFLFFFFTFKFHKLTLKIRDRGFSGSTEARIFELGICMDEKLLFHGIVNSC